ncbi:MAG: hypothetical protein U0528_15250 [Anaerolineae bacterium]
MLIRALRVTDKLGTALLRFTIWLGDVLLAQIYRLRLALFDAFSVIILLFTRVRAGGAVIEGNLERRRAIAARRAAEMATRTVVREDPLKHRTAPQHLHHGTDPRTDWCSVVVHQQ